MDEQIMKNRQIRALNRLGTLSIQFKRVLRVRKCQENNFANLSERVATLKILKHNIVFIYFRCFWSQHNFQSQLCFSLVLTSLLLSTISWKFKCFQTFDWYCIQIIISQIFLCSFSILCVSSQTQGSVKWRVPPSWRLLFGSGIPPLLF